MSTEDVRCWKRTDKLTIKGEAPQETLVTALFVRKALRSARGLSDVMAAYTVDAAAIGEVLETDYFTYERLDVAVQS